MAWYGADRHSNNHHLQSLDDLNRHRCSDAARVDSLDPAASGPDRGEGVVVGEELVLLS